MNIVRSTENVLDLYQSAKPELMIFWIAVLIGLPIGIGTLLISRDILNLLVAAFFLSPLLFFLTDYIPDVCTLDKNAQKICFRKRGMLRSKVQEYWLHEISDVELVVESSTAYIVFVFASGDKEKFGRSKDPEKVAEMSRSVLQFLELMP
jgi:hypothetical protein